jgi:hypothetical protein
MESVELRLKVARPAGEVIQQLRGRGRLPQALTNTERAGSPWGGSIGPHLPTEFDSAVLQR